MEEFNFRSTYCPAVQIDLNQWSLLTSTLKGRDQEYHHQGTSFPKNGLIKLDQ